MYTDLLPEIQSESHVPDITILVVESMEDGHIAVAESQGVVHVCQGAGLPTNDTVLTRLQNNQQTMHRAHNCKTTDQFLKQTSSVYLHNYKTISDILIKHRKLNKSYDFLQHLMPNFKEISGQCKIINPKKNTYFENKRILKFYLRENKIAEPSNTVYIVPVDVSCGEIWEMLSNSRKWSEENKFIITSTAKEHSTVGKRLRRKREVIDTTAGLRALK